MALELWIPESAREKVKPDLICMVNDCSVRFPAEQREQWIRHVTMHVRRDPEEYERAAHERENDGVLTPIDKELAEWIRRHKATGNLPRSF